MGAEQCGQRGARPGRGGAALEPQAGGGGWGMVPQAPEQVAESC